MKQLNDEGQNDEFKNNSALSIQHSSLTFTRGRGIEKITDACKQAGLPEPIIVERTGGIAVELMKSQASDQLGNQLVIPKNPQ
jgi:predicted HTH transcriptional regulator